MSGRLFQRGYRCNVNARCVLERKHAGDCQLEKQPGDRARAAALAVAPELLEGNRACFQCAHASAMHVDGEARCTALDCECEAFE